MTETELFALIAEARDDDSPSGASADPDALQEVLERCSDEELVEFLTEWERQLVRLNRWELWAAGYLIAGGMGDDHFHYFRSWIVGKGPDAVAQALGDPDGLVDFLDDAGAEEDFDNELLEYAALEVLETRGADELDPRGGGEQSADDVPTGERFDEESDLAGRFPRIAAWLAAR